VSAIGRVGGSGTVSRDSASSGLEAADRARDEAAGFLPLDSRGRAQARGQAPRNEKIDEVSKLYEKQFLREMVKAMRSTVSFSDVTKPSMAENIYRDQLDEQYVESWGDQGGVGLSNMIYEQLMEKFFGGSDSDAGAALKKQGPIALTDRDVSRVARMPSAVPNSNQLPLRIEVKPSPNGGPVQVHAPWDATVVAKAQVEGGKTAVTLEHLPGVKSTVIFDGVAASEIEPGKKVSKGQTVGVLSPEKSSFFWNLSRVSSARSPGGAEAL
jgi:flagellar protein FlgJ